MSVALITSPARAHETDQYTLPDGRQFAERGPALSRWFYRAIERGVEKQNSVIRAAVESGRGQSDIQRLQSPDQIVAAVNAQFPYAVPIIEDLDRGVDSPQLAARYPGQLVGYKPPPSISKYLLFPLNPFRAWNCATIKVYGSYIGTDKVGHFTDMGMHYYQAYRDAIRRGADEDGAMAHAIKCGTEDPITSEQALLGYWTAGAYSNADLVANFSGFLFYRNLTEPLMLKGQARPAMLVRDGAYWAIAEQVREDPNFFRWFISDHFDEAMNPSLYLPQMRDGIRQMARDNSSALLNLRCDVNGERHTRQWFAENMCELSTYWGVNYGHRGNGELIRIDHVCFAATPKDLQARNKLGRTALHCAVEAGDLERVQELIAKGAEVNAVIRSDERSSPDWGQTPLHLAAADGRADIVQVLLEAGADARARSDRGVTPLHRATGNEKTLALLLERGADVNIADGFGRTPLHWAAREGDLKSVAVLMDHRANPNARDRDGRTALFDAVAAGSVQVVDELLRRGSDPAIADNFHTTPLHAAASAPAPTARPILAALMRGGRVQPDVRDDFGCTPLHEAVRAQNGPAVASLLRYGANPSAADSYGLTPLRIAQNGPMALLIRSAVPAGNQVQPRALSTSAR